MATKIGNIVHFSGDGEFKPVSETKTEALAFAESKGFQRRCVRDLVWQGEDEGELLNLVTAFVENFKPRTNYELALLKNIIEAQWAIERASKVRKAIAESVDGLDWETCQPAGPSKASAKFEREQSQLLSTLEKTIRLYNRNR